ncbi:hypothetical protein E3N88_01573 [Mikania micrantha]|uniref:non-specific serine/threonine protein kinase n=1 Tax=Mikania micrantha TaxID=192012 RepID=A0A5N6Q2U9_9ASTR|nr:hypothetical protein E3N88_01573 [Mikania micrantha]
MGHMASNGDVAEAQQLVFFKSSLKNPNLLQDWVAGNDPCNFTGVSCRNSRVSAINLSFVDLSIDFGLISSSLLTVATLESFVARSCNVTGTVAVRSQCSKVLRVLDLGGNRISGSVADLSSLSVCPNLKSVNFSKNLMEFNGGLNPIGVSLKVIDLSFNRIAGPAVVPWILSDGCGELVQFNVSGNNISGTVPESLKSCSLLEVFDISRNNFSGELPMDTLLSLTKLKTLMLGFNNFNGKLPESLSELTSLERFDVSSNEISGEIPAGICDGTTAGSSRLQMLYLQNNRLTGSIPATIGNCSELASLDLSFNTLTGEIPKQLRYLSKLEDLIIWMNLLSGEIPEELMYLTNLENLILDFNYLTGSIPSSLSNCTNLNWISLSNNKLDGEIPAALGGLSNLAILKLGNNSFSGKIPPELGDCKSLVWLDLNTNQLSGTIPPDLFKQSGYIADAYLTGKPYLYIKNDGSKQCHGAGNLLEFGGIRQVDLDRISSRHPCSFTRVYLGITQPNFNHNGSMIFFDLSYNKLEGGIPKELGSMYYLNILNLGHNDLTGPIPEELSGLKSIAILDLSHNRLNGSIPISLTSLGLGDADLSYNNLSGSIPESAPFDTFPADRFSNNSGLCGYPLPKCGSGQNDRSNSHRKSNKREASLAGSVAMGLLFSLFCIFGVILVLVEMRKRRRKKAAAALEAFNDGGVNSYSDEYLEARVSDFGMARHMSAMDTHLSVSTLAGTPGYVPPEYYQSFRCSTKGDVYSYGVVLLELLTGKQPTDSPDFGDNNLVGWVKLHAKTCITDVLDPDLLTEDPTLMVELLQHLKVACACLDDRPWKRPTMIQVMAMFKEIQAGSGLDSTSTVDAGEAHFSTVEMSQMTIKEDGEQIKH